MMGDSHVLTNIRKSTGTPQTIHKGNHKKRNEIGDIEKVNNIKKGITASATKVSCIE